MSYEPIREHFEPFTKLALRPDSKSRILHQVLASSPESLQGVRRNFWIGATSVAAVVIVAVGAFSIAKQNGSSQPAIGSSRPTQVAKGESGPTSSQSSTVSYPVGSPESVVNQWLQAYKMGDWKTAAQYMSDYRHPNQADLEAYYQEQVKTNPLISYSINGMKLVDATHATVTVTITDAMSKRSQTFNEPLEKHNGVWKIYLRTPKITLPPISK